MSDIDSTLIDDGASASSLGDVPPPVPPAPAPPVIRPRPQRRGGIFALLLLLIVLGGAAYFYWRMQSIEAGHDQSTQSELAATQKLGDQVQTLATKVDTAQREAAALRERLNDAAKVNDSLRGEMLGLSERARVAEDAIARLADQRLSGRDAMLVDEAELLLVLGGERFVLFHDPQPAIAAYKLADTALGEVNNVAFSTVRQSINAEIGALNALDAAAPAALQTRIETLLGVLPTLPNARHDATDEAVQSSRWRQIFGQFIRVRRDDDAESFGVHYNPLLARSLVDANLREAQAALLLRDETRFRASLAAASAQLGVNFDTQASAVQQAQATLDELGKANLAPPAPNILGAALKELRNLRTAHAMPPAASSSAPAPTPVPAAPAADHT